MGRHLRAQDLRAATASVETLAAMAGDGAAFVHDVLDELPKIVPSELTTLSLCDLKAGTRRVVARENEALSAADCAAFDRHFRHHPLVRFHGRHPTGPTTRLSDFASIGKLRRSALFSEYYQRIGIAYVMALPLWVDETNLISVVFNRSRSDFRDRERAMLEAVRRPLAALYRGRIDYQEAARGLSCLEGLAADAGWQVVRMTADGRIVEMSPAAGRILSRFFGRGGEIPGSLLDWLRRSRNWGLDRHLPGVGDAFVVARGGARFTARFVADPMAAGRGTLLIKEERERLQPRHLTALPLSAREREVLALVAAGKTNAEIGLILDVSPHTVRKHLEHVFQKLGVETRTAAAARAFAAAAAPGATA